MKILLGLLGPEESPNQEWPEKAFHETFPGKIKRGCPRISWIAGLEKVLVMGVAN